MTKNKNEMPEGSIKAECAWSFITKAAALAAPWAKPDSKQGSDVMEHIAVATLVQLATGKAASVKISVDIRDGVAKGFIREIDSEGLEQLAKMNEQEIISSIVPQIIDNMTDTMPNIRDFINDILGGLGKKPANEDDNGDTKESQEQDAQAAS